MPNDCSQAVSFRSMVSCQSMPHDLVLIGRLCLCRTRWLNWRVDIISLLALLLVVLPFTHCYRLLAASSALLHPTQFMLMPLKEAHLVDLCRLPYDFRRMCC